VSAPRDSVILDGRTLTPAGVATVARGGATAELDPAARARNSAAAAAVAELLDRGEPVYGVTTGVGGFRSRDVPPSERSGQQLRLLRSHACGGGRLLAPELVRAAMVVRANQLGAGGAGVSDGLLGALVDAVNAGFAPASSESTTTGGVPVMSRRISA
jgi:histidine ammonia-lyase